MTEHGEQHAISEAIVLTDRRRGEAEALGHKLDAVERFSVLGDKWLCRCGAFVAEMAAGERRFDTVWNDAALARCPLAPKQQEVSR